MLEFGLLRHLNFLAYTNRAMIANHAAVGHFVSYVSWVRYIHDSIEYIDRVTQWIPSVGQYVDTVEQIAEQVREIQRTLVGKTSGTEADHLGIGPGVPGPSSDGTQRRPRARS